MKGTDAPQPIKTGNVVLIHDDSPRTNWKMAMVQRLIKGNDGYVRAAEIKTNTGRTNRPISKLYPLEISANEEDTSAELKTDNNRPPPMMQRSMRKSATKAKDKLSQWSKQVIGLPLPGGC